MYLLVVDVSAEMEGGVQGDLFVLKSAHSEMY